MNQKRLKGVKVEEIERAYEKCLVYFYAFPRRTIGLTDLSTSIKASKTATKQAVEGLIRQEFLTRDVAGKTWVLSVNQKHQDYSKFIFLRKKVLYHIDKIYESGIMEAVYKSVPQARAIILFGSYRWGDDTEESDIDIAVEVLDNNEMQVVKLGIVEQLGHRKDVPVNLHIFNRNKIDLNLFSNIANGFILDGFLEVRP